MSFRVKLGPPTSQSGLATGHPPAGGRAFCNPRGDARAGLVFAEWRTRSAGVRGRGNRSPYRRARGDEHPPPLIIVRRASTRSTSFVLAALRALHVDRAFTAGALLRYRGNAELCWDA